MSDWIEGVPSTNGIYWIKHGEMMDLVDIVECIKYPLQFITSYRRCTESFYDGKSWCISCTYPLWN